MPTRVRTLSPRHAPTRSDARREADARRRERSPWRALYKTPRWQAIRTAQLAAEPLCRLCLGEERVTPATVCDHVDRHGGNPDKFFNGRRQSLCKWHHDSVKQREENVGARDGATLVDE